MSIFFFFTWAQCGARHPLEGRALAKGSPVQRGRIGTAARSPLPAPPTPSVALRPLGPRRPASAYWWGVEGTKVGEFSGRFIIVVHGAVDNKMLITR